MRGGELGNYLEAFSPGRLGLELTSGGRYQVCNRQRIPDPPLRARIVNTEPATENEVLVDGEQILADASGR